MTTPPHDLAARNVRVILAAKTAEHLRAPTDEEIELWATIYELTAFQLRRYRIERAASAEAAASTGQEPKAIPDPAPVAATPPAGDTTPAAVEGPVACRKCHAEGHRYGVRCPLHPRYKGTELPAAVEALAPPPVAVEPPASAPPAEEHVEEAQVVATPPPAAPAPPSAPPAVEEPQAPASEAWEPPVLLVTMLAALRGSHNGRMAVYAGRIEAQATIDHPTTDDEVRALAKTVGAAKNITVYGMIPRLQRYFLAPGEVATMPSQPTPPAMPVAKAEKTVVKRNHHITVPSSAPNMVLGGAVAAPATQKANSAFLQTLIDPKSKMPVAVLPPKPPPRSFYPG